MKDLFTTVAKYKYFSLLLLLLLLPYVSASISSQTRERAVNPKPAVSAVEVVKVDVDLVTVDALVLQKKTARVVGQLKQTDFVILEDGTKQEVTHFSQDSLPLSVVLLIDRGGCIDPFGTEVRHAANEALRRLKETDEVAVMTYQDNVELIQEFTRDRKQIESALERIPEKDEWADHCLNKAFARAADYMVTAGNSVGRRVIIVITGITRNFDCGHGPSGKVARQAIYESGSVVCGLIPKTAVQRMENKYMVWGTKMAGVFGARTMDIKELAAETGGEVLEEKPERLDATFTTLIDHLRTRYNLAFVSSNRKRDGTLRKLKIDVTPAVQKQEKLVVKARRSYVAPKQ